MFIMDDIGTYRGCWFLDLFDEFGHIRKVAYLHILMNVPITDVDMYVECWHPTLEIRWILDSTLGLESSENLTLCGQGIWSPMLGLGEAGSLAWPNREYRDTTWDLGPSGSLTLDTQKGGDPTLSLGEVGGPTLSVKDY